MKGICCGGEIQYGKNLKEVINQFFSKTYKYFLQVEHKFSY